MPTFGVSTTDGTISPCRAKPENRGKGSCTHGDHVELDGAMASSETIQRFNEERLAEHYGATQIRAVRPPTPNSMVRSPGGGTSLTAQEFRAAAAGLADAFDQDHWELLNNFYSRFDTLLEEEAQLEHTKAQATTRLRNFLTSNDPVAVKIRSFLGPEIDVGSFSSILVNQVESMVASKPLRNSRKSDSMRRVVLTSASNDMTKRRYVASVLYFGGRCCYCNVPMKKIPGPSQATGEHITPLNPEDGGPVGTTRYGNMALACMSCNRDRANTELNKWMSETDKVKPELKNAALERIERFRAFALYEEYSPKQNEVLNQAVEDLRHEAEQYEKTDGRYGSEDFSTLTTKIKAKLFDLRGDLEAS